jgi:hypothetical protein
MNLVSYVNNSSSAIVFSHLWRNATTKLYFFSGGEGVLNSGDTLETFGYAERLYSDATPTIEYIIDAAAFSDPITSLRNERPLDSLLKSPYILEKRETYFRDLKANNYIISYPK